MLENELNTTALSEDFYAILQSNSLDTVIEALETAFERKAAYLGSAESLPFHAVSRELRELQQRDFELDDDPLGLESPIQ